MGDVTIWLIHTILCSLGSLQCLSSFHLRSITRCGTLQLCYLVLGQQSLATRCGQSELHLKLPSSQPLASYCHQHHTCRRRTAERHITSCRPRLPRLQTRQGQYPACFLCMASRHLHLAYSHWQARCLHGSHMLNLSLLTCGATGSQTHHLWHTDQRSFMNCWRP